MNNCQVLELIQNPIISRDAALYNIQRLITGNLQHIGAAILDGKSICDGAGKCTDLLFTCCADSYTIKPETITLNNIEVPKPFIPEMGEKYWLSYSGGAVDYTWANDTTDNRVLNLQPIFKSQQDCIDFYAGLMGAIK
jgi:hypothetical protein